MALTPPFATTSDLTARWRTLTAGETTRAATLLADASQMILDEDTRGVLDNFTTATSTLVRIVCNMVIRAMSAPIADGPPVSQQSMGMGPFSESYTFANPTGDLYLTKSERRQLGFSRQRAGGSDMWTGAYPGIA